MDYQRIYNQIIDRAKLLNRKKYKGEYFEEHHITPTCLGGSNKKENRVLLTAREHFICHKLLVEIYPNNNKLIYALWMMSIIKLEERDYRVSSREYERIKKEFSILMSINTSGENNPNFGKVGTMKGRVGNLSPLFGYVFTEDEKLNRSNRIKLNNPMDREDVRIKIGKLSSIRAKDLYNKNVEENDGVYFGGKGEHCIHSGKSNTEESNKKRSKSQSGDKAYWYKKNLPLEACSKMSATANARPILTCPHCGFQGKGGNMKTRHFDNCKLSPNYIQPLKVECPHCHKLGFKEGMWVHHFENCKHKE